ncbi:MAG: hypothetical protein IJ527_03995 [Prevotella sp.]|nr:hypothetical protein [Prevotella sp.]
MARQRRGTFIVVSVLTLWSVACFCFFQFCYPYHFFYKEQNQLFLMTSDWLRTYFDDGCGWLANMGGEFLTQFYYYLYAGATILTLCLTALAVTTHLALKWAGVNRYVSLAIGLIVATVEAVFHLHYKFPLSGTLSLLGWMAVVCLFSRYGVRGTRCEVRGARYEVRGARLAARIIIGVLLLPLAVWLFGAPTLGKIAGPDWYAERQLSVDCEYYFGNWNKVERLVEQDNERTPEMLFYYYLVQAQRGKLPDQLLHFDHPELGTFYTIGPETPMFIIKSMNELYWTLGDMTYTERAAMLGNVFSPNNRNVRMIKRLAECSIVSGDSAATRKYLGVLEHTLAFRQWAKNAPQNQLYTEKMQFVNRKDTISLGDNAHNIMMQLLDSNPDNTVALDYILCSNLLLKDVQNFKRDYDRYCTDLGRTRLNTLYQEALCIWLAASHAPQEDWEKYIKRQDVMHRFAEYNEQRGHPKYKGTYWYYYDKAKKPNTQ